MKRTFLLLFTIWSVGILAQSETISDSALIAMEKADMAQVLFDQEKFSEGLSLMKEAAALQPNHYQYAFQVGFIYFQLRNYNEAVKQLEKTKSMKGCEEGLFQLLGNTYYILSDKTKAMATFDQGLSKFPESGLLYAEKGKLYQETDHGKALYYFEKGIELDPNFAMNYFHAAMLYFQQAENIKGILHGEIFMLLNRNTNFTAAMSELLYNEYKESILIKDNGKLEFHFCNPVKSDAIVSLKNMKTFPPFCVAYSSMLNESGLNVNVLNAANIHALRAKVLEKYYADHLNEHYQEWVFDFQNVIQQAGHLEAYNHWLMMNGSELEFLQWKENNEEEWSAFTSWFSQHDMTFPE